MFFAGFVLYSLGMKQTTAFNVGDRVILNLDDDQEVFIGLIDTWEAQTEIPPPTSADDLNGSEATVIEDLDEDGMIDVRLDNGVEFVCSPEELELKGP